MPKMRNIHSYCVSYVIIDSPDGTVKISRCTFETLFFENFHFYIRDAPHLYQKQVKLETKNWKLIDG